jgi:hypothetical protein
MKIADVVFNKNNNIFYHRHFLPFRRADLTASTLLQGIRSRISTASYPVPRICGNLNS